ncbi:hypothetical protein EDB84DRAFT_1571788 [Lactarius hengduanensis]|nr:hypothetical protein EDB84DRAFT_1571788 [Lactarius hengduanensis]
MGIIDESDKVYARPLYAAPRFSYGGKPMYPATDMALFTLPSRIGHEEEHLNQRINDLIATLREITGKVTGSHRRLEMANAMEHIEDEVGTMVDHEMTKKKTRRGRKTAQQLQPMSEEVCNMLALAYDPSVKLNMISANGSINQLLRLAHNIAFSISDITLYMQVHILQSPAYDILLGRLFNILTQSVMHKYCNENQSITICNPNTRKTAM